MKTKDRPILFSAPMILALLAGNKTQTRRIVKPQPTEVTRSGSGILSALYRPNDFSWPSGVQGCSTISCKPNGPDGWAAEHSPYGQPGDRLWVREAHWWFKDEPDHSCGYYPPKLTVEDVVYRADGDDGSKVWRPSIHMPRWASRITLDVTGVRVERLQSISEADAVAEGCTQNHNGYFWGGPHKVSGQKQMATAVKAYADLWESINGPTSWAANPWVWAVEFKRVAQ